MTEIKFDATKCNSLLEGIKYKIEGWEVLDDSIVPDGRAACSHLYWGICKNSWRGGLHKVKLEKENDLKKMYDSVLNKGWLIIAYEEEEYDKYEKLLQEKNINIKYTNEGDPFGKGFNIHFTEDSLKKLFYGNV